MDDAEDAPKAAPYAVIGEMWRAAGVPYEARIEATEARRAVCALWKVAGRKVRQPYIRPVWLRQGWRRLVHNLSHLSHRAHAWRGNSRPHAWNHLAWERAFTAHAIAKGWHLGTLRAKARPPKPKPDPKALKAARAAARLKAWRTRLKRAQTAVAKLERAQRAQARRAASAPQHTAP